MAGVGTCCRCSGARMRPAALPTGLEWWGACWGAACALLVGSPFELYHSLFAECLPVPGVPHRALLKLELVCRVHLRFAPHAAWGHSQSCFMDRLWQLEACQLSAACSPAFSPAPVATYLVRLGAVVGECRAASRAHAQQQLGDTTNAFACSWPAGWLGGCSGATHEQLATMTSAYNSKYGCVWSCWSASKLQRSVACQKTCVSCTAVKRPTSGRAPALSWTAPGTTGWTSLSLGCWQCERSHKECCCTCAAGPHAGECANKQCILAAV
ncbi:hypothetical protein COO60DRAFT_1530869 [Scenedesmus sp. NREL 46B-D3]|nr:hypothetical protein COO60DRAFT_1530869 [Scenedesmus sp. NREL 46B-D3]